MYPCSRQGHVTSNVPGGLAGEKDDMLQFAVEEKLSVHAGLFRCLCDPPTEKSSQLVDAIQE